MDDIVFESDRINFIRLKESLIDDYLLMMNDINVQKCISNEVKTYTYDGEVKWVNKNLEGHRPVFSMLEKDTNDFIGNIELLEVNDNIGTIGISITPNKQDKKYGTEAMKRFMKYVIDKYNLLGLDLYVYDFNKRAIKCYENVGFKITGKGKMEGELHMEYSKGE